MLTLRNEWDALVVTQVRTVSLPVRRRAPLTRFVQPCTRGKLF
jgi:hypothetical protein